MPSAAVQGSTSTNVFVKALQWGGWRWDDGTTPGTNITYFFDPGGKSLGSSFGTSTAWLSYQKEAYERALDSWANVANITFTEVTSYGDADLVEHVYFNGNSSILGIHETPQHADQSDGTAWGAYNTAGPGWTNAGLQEGGFALSVIVHEIGHALGLAHPHDNGGGSGVFPGVTSNSDSGNNDLNQGIFTIMSYIDGWEELGSSSSANYGWSAGPMAFDIAAIQALYGANTSHNAGNNTYVLRHQAGDPDALEAIWDTGGIDSIEYRGKYAVTIDLRAATLEAEPGGGGFVSYAKGAPSSHLDHWNAFTIANGVVIENAVGGKGNDRISGNGVDNKLFGLAGNDAIIGRAGDDTLIGGTGQDRLSGGSGEDVFDFNAASHSRPSTRDFISHFQRGQDEIDLSTIDAKTGRPGNQEFKWIGKADFHDKKGELHYEDLGSKVLVEGDVNGDGQADFALLVRVGKITGGDFDL